MTKLLDASIELSDNAMLKKYPDLFKEWNFEKNVEINIYDVSYGKNIKVWWTCLKCESNYYSSITNRTKGHGCPYCRGLKVNHTNSLASLRPDLASQWHRKLNGKWTPDNVTCGKNLKAWWFCDKGHEFKSAISVRNSGTGCPYCSNSLTLKGFNDMWTTNPELAKQLLNPEDGYKYTQGSKTKLDWKCDGCNSEIKNKRIMDVKNKGLNCQLCQGTLKYPERFLKILLDEIDENYIHDRELAWSNKKRYDFYLPEYNLIIETHGGQHFDEGFEFCGGNTLQEEQENDRYKEQLARENGIEHYIVIDCRYSKFNFIKDNVLSSQLIYIFDLSKINWEEVKRKVNRNILQTIAEDWNRGFTSKEVAKRNKISFKKTLILLEDATKSGYCNYIKEKDEYLNSLAKKESIYKINKDLEIVDEYLNDDVRFETDGMTKIYVTDAISRKRLYNEHYWCRSKTWESRKHLYESIEKEKRDKRLNPILQIDMNGTILKKWTNPIEILDAHKDYLSAPLYNAMNGNQNSYKGFIWVKEKEYDIKIIEDKIYKMKESGLARVKNRLILQIDKFTGDIVGEANGVKNASVIAGVSENSMGKCIYKKRKTTGGYIWMYEEEYKTEEGLKWVEDIVNSNK